MNSLFIDIVGWAGTGLLVTAYILVSTGKRTARSYLYQGLNLLGSVGLGINALANDTLPSVAINVIWIFIGLVTVYSIWKR